MSTITRTIRYIRRIGFKEAARQLFFTIGDTKAGTLVGVDRFGNKFYENQTEELPLRDRWVDYKLHYYDNSQIEPGWHAWTVHMVTDPPSKDPTLQPGQKPWHTGPVDNKTMTPAAYVCYSTIKPKVEAWEPCTAKRIA